LCAGSGDLGCWSCGVLARHFRSFRRGAWALLLGCRRVRCSWSSVRAVPVSSVLVAVFACPLTACCLVLCRVCASGALGVFCSSAPVVGGPCADAGASMRLFFGGCWIVWAVLSCWGARAFLSGWYGGSFLLQCLALYLLAYVFTLSLSAPCVRCWYARVLVCLVLPLRVACIDARWVTEVGSACLRRVLFALVSLRSVSLLGCSPSSGETFCDCCIAAGFRACPVGTWLFLAPVAVRCLLLASARLHAALWASPLVCSLLVPEA